MSCRLALGVLGMSLLSCASPLTIYDSRDEDAVPIYRALAGRFPTLPPVVSAAFDREPTNPAELDAAIASFEPILQELSRAARARRCAWTYETPPTIAAEYPLDYVLTAARLLVVRSRRRLESGNGAASLEDLLVLQRFGSDLLQDRWTIGKLLGLIAGTWAGFELQDRLAKGRLDRSDLSLVEEHLTTLLRRFPPPETLLRDEKTMAVPLLKEIRDLGLDEVTRRVAKDTSEPKDNPPIVALWHDWLRRTLGKDMDLATRRISRRWDERIALLEEAYRKPLNSGDLRRQMADLKEESRTLSDRLARRMLGFAPKGDEGYEDIADLIFRLWVPALEKVAARQAEHRLLLEFTLLGCRLELRRLSSGSYPEQLDDGGEIPKDPFVGGLIRYRRIVRPDGEGYVLAAAGPKDDAQERIRLFSEECRFELERFQESGSADSDTYTFGVFRRR